MPKIIKLNLSTMWIFMVYNSIYYWLQCFNRHITTCSYEVCRLNRRGMTISLSKTSSPVSKLGRRPGMLMMYDRAWCRGQSQRRALQANGGNYLKSLIDLRQITRSLYRIKGDKY